jgi:ArsR family transcriptional regulator
MSATRASETLRTNTKASVDVINAELFRALGHPVRIRVLELLRARKEMSVRELQGALQIEPGAASQHLSAMRRPPLLATRRRGTSVFYRVRDPRTFQLLDLARQVLTAQVQHTQALLDHLNEQRPAPHADARASGPPRKSP